MTRSKLIAVVLALASAALCLFALALLAATWGAPVGAGSWGFRGFGLMEAIGFTALGTVLAIRRPANPIGWLLLISGAFWALTDAFAEYAVYAIVGQVQPMPGGVLAAWLCSWLWAVSVSVYPVLLLIFPDGRVGGPVRRALLIAVGLIGVLLAASMAVRPGPLQGAAFVDNPFTPFSADTVGLVNTLNLAVTFPTLIGAALSLVQRFRRSTGIERQQLKWLAYAALPIVVVGPLSGVIPGKPIQIVGALGQLVFPTLIAVAVLRYRLYDIDVLINRTLVYVSTTAVIAIAFFGGIIVAQAILRPLTGGSEVAVAVSTLACFALFQPVRRRVQSAVDRRFYRARYDAGRTLDLFTSRLADEVDLEAVRAELLNAVAGTVQPASASVWLRERVR